MFIIQANNGDNMCLLSNVYNFKKLTVYKDILWNDIVLTKVLEHPSLLMSSLSKFTNKVRATRFGTITKLQVFLLYGNQLRNSSEIGILNATDI